MQKKMTKKFFMFTLIMYMGYIVKRIDRRMDLPILNRLNYKFTLVVKIPFEVVSLTKMTPLD